MRKLGLPKRLLWIWETICYGTTVGYAIKAVIYGVTEKDTRIVISCIPTVLLMLVFGEVIYQDKIKWSSFRPHQWVIPLLVFTGCTIYGILNDYFVFQMAAGFLVTYILLMSIAFKDIL